MTLRALRPEPCWQVNDASTGAPYEWFYEEGWPHYATRERALQALAEDVARVGEYVEPGELVEAPTFVVAPSFSAPCVGLFCDGPDCAAVDEPLDWTDDGGTHLDPADPFQIDLRDVDWVEIDGKHYCTDCTEHGTQRIRDAIAELDRTPGPGQLEVPW